MASKQTLELDVRSTDGLEVALLWQPETNRITVSVYDSKTGDDFDIEVDPAEATDAFHHPYAYAASRGVHFVAGTRISIDVLTRYPELKPERVMIDHAEEHTIEMIRDRGFWAGLTLYPQTKVSPERAIDMFERYGTDRICVASACDWGPSLPDAVPHFALAMRRRGHAAALIDSIIYGNPIAFLGQSPKFDVGAEPRSGEAATTVSPRDHTAATSSAGVAAA